MHKHRDKFQLSSSNKDLSAVLTAFWDSQVHTHHFIGSNNIAIACAWTIPQNAHTAVVVLNGRAETFLKYQEVIYDLFQNGFAVFTLDHRGQGISGRMLSNFEQGYIEHFDEYVVDIMRFIDIYVKPNWDGPLALLCHSMGGAIGTLTLAKSPHLFHKAILCSPMFGIKPALPNWLAKALLHVGQCKTKLKGKQADYFFGQTNYIAHPFILNSLTHCEVRYQRMLKLYADNRKLRIGGVTTQWLSAAVDAMNRIENIACDVATPMLIFGSGNDRIIDNKRQAKVAKQFANASYTVVEGAHHELLFELDEHRNDVLHKSMQFLTE